MWAGVDSVWQQEKPEARKMLENAAESPASSAPMMSAALILYGKTWLRSENALLANFALWLRFLLFKDRFPYNLNDAQDKQCEENRRQNAFDDCG
ncbi:MAG: hypothetical protein HZB52_13645 [Chloroflexi bacterium]|nr:hypothetical protein [Chloroflexota bacterium]